MDRKNKIKNNFNKAAKNYDLYTVLQRDIADKLSIIFLANINEKDIILDAGCGTGYIHKLITESGFNNPVIQIDLSYGMCKKARENSYEKEGLYINSDIENIGLRSESLNIIISSSALQWTDIELSLENFYQSLLKNGKLFFSIFSENTLEELAASFKDLDGNERINKFYSKKYIENILISTKFNNIKIIEDKITNFYKTSIDLIKEIKYMGAGYRTGKYSNLTLKDIKQLDTIYQRKFGNNGLLPASWNFLLVSACKF